MGDLLNIDLVGMPGVQKGLASLKTSMEDLTGFWTDVFAPKYFASVQDLFKTSGTPRGEGGKFSGAPWTKLTPLYAQWKYKVYPGMPILSATGRLRDSLAWSGTGIGAEGIFEATPGYVQFGTTVPYAGAHQHGTKRMPKRTFLIQPDPAVFAPLLKQWILKMSGWSK